MNKLIIILALFTYETSFSRNTPSKSPMEAKVILDNNCNQDVSAESPLSIVAEFLIPKIIGGGLNAIESVIKDKAVEDKEIAVGHFGSYFYIPRNIRDDPEVFYKLKLNNQCFKITIPSNTPNKALISLDGHIEYDLDGAVFRLVVDDLKYYNYTGKKRQKKRNVEFLFKYSVTNKEDGSKVFASTPISFLQITPPSKKDTYYTPEISNKSSLWMNLPPFSQDLGDRIDEYNNSENQERNLKNTILINYNRWQSVYSKRYSSYTINKNEIDDICKSRSDSYSDLNDSSVILEERIPEIRIEKEIEESKKKKSIEKLKDLRLELAEITNKKQYLNDCLAYYELIEDKKPNLTEYLKFPRVPFDLTVHVYETVDKPVLKFFAGFFDEDSKNKLKDDLVNEFSPTARENAESASLISSLNGKQAVWEAIKVAEEAQLDYEAETDPLQKAKNKIIMIHKQRLANVAARLNNIELPYPQIGI